MSFIDTIPRLSEVIRLTVDDIRAIEMVDREFPLRITRYYASLMDTENPSCPIRLQAVPDIRELDRSYGDPDPLQEEVHSPVPSVIRVYPDRIAVIVTNRCPVYCRFCLRKRLIRSDADDLKGERLRTVVSFIKRDTSIRDVLLTGGEPLMLEDDELDTILGEIRAVGHVEIIRIGTRVPCTWPERITGSLVDMLASHHPVWVNTQFNHPSELTEAARYACDLFLRRGIPVGNQTVLLRGVNDSADVMLKLVRELVRSRIRPYYLYQAQTLSGTGHFVTTIEKGLEIMRRLRGFTTGFAVPQYVLDTPYGKVPLNPEYLKGRDGDYVVMESYNGRIWREYNPS